MKAVNGEVRGTGNISQSVTPLWVKLRWCGQLKEVKEYSGNQKMYSLDVMLSKLLFLLYFVAMAMKHWNFIPPYFSISSLTTAAIVSGHFATSSSVYPSLALCM